MYRSQAAVTTRLVAATGVGCASTEDDQGMSTNAEAGSDAASDGPADDGSMAGAYGKPPTP